MIVAESQSEKMNMQVQRPLKILWTLPYLPWPTTSGGKLRQYHLLKQLAARGHRLTLLVQSKVPLDDAVKHALEAIVERLIVLPRRSLKHPVSLAAALLSRYPMLVSVNGYAAALEQQFEALLHEPWDIVQIEHSYGLQPFLNLLQTKRQPFVMTEHNVESSLGAATYQHWPSWLKPYVAYDQWRYRRWESIALNAPKRLLAVTTEDAQRLSEQMKRQVDVVINGVDVAQFSGVTPDYHGHRVLFIGNMEYPPNIDAVEWVVEEILPKVWQQSPQVTFAVCGYALPERWRQKWTDPRIEWIGFVPELTKEQAKSTIFLAALREGGGSKLKVLEAMAAGLPLVSTAQGVSGLNVEDQTHYYLANEPQQMANAISALVNQPQIAAKLGEAARTYVQQHHDWSVAADQLETVYRELVDANRH